LQDAFTFPNPASPAQDSSILSYPSAHAAKKFRVSATNKRTRLKLAAAFSGFRRGRFSNRCIPIRRA
jgi:hypothetical protein